jgi:DNA-binding CsgD family transcriptional regulator
MASCPGAVRNAMRKLGTHGRIETVVTARRLGHLP